MADLGALLKNQGFIVAASAVAGWLLRDLLANFRGRLRVLEYSVSHERVGLSTDDAIFGNVTVTWQGAPVQNLFLSTVRIPNTTSLDFSDLVLHVYTGNTLLLTDRAVIVGSTYAPTFTDEWRERLAVPPGGTPTELQFRTYYHSREYRVPVLNRNERVEFVFLTSVPNADDKPSVWVDLLHKGVKLQFRPFEQQIHGVPIKLALPLGLLTCLIVLVLASAFSPRMWIAAVIAMLVGLFAQSIGAGVYRALRMIKGVIFR